MRITEEEQGIRRNRMLHTAYALFCEYGIDRVSVVQVAKAAGVNRNSIFRYFNTKAELVQCTQIILWQEITQHILQDSENLLLNAKDGLEEVKILIYNFKSLYENHSNYILFSCDYRLFLIRNNIMLSEEQHDKIMSPIYFPFINALEKGQVDGSIDTSETVMTQFFTLWGILRGYVEEIATYDRMYAGNNPWRNQFDLVLYQIVYMLAKKCKAHSTD